MANVEPDIWYPWAVALYMKPDVVEYTGVEAGEGERSVPAMITFSFGCTGTIIGHQWIATAQHCMVNLWQPKYWGKVLNLVVSSSHCPA